MFDFDTPFFPGMLTLIIILLFVFAVRKSNEPREPVDRKHVVASIVGVVVVSLIGLVAVLVVANQAA